MGEVEFHGIVEALPASGTLGDWIVGGRVVVVTALTKIKTEHGPVEVGACVEVEGTAVMGGTIAAAEIETEAAAVCTPRVGKGPSGKIEFKGLIETAPSNGLVGEWKIGGRTVVAVSSTVFKPATASFVAGACVEVEGSLQAAGILQATEISIESGGQCGAPSPAGMVAEFEFKGNIESLPASGFVGIWVVAGRMVQVSTGTELETRNGPFVVGACVEVEGTRLMNGHVAAAEIELKPSSECTAERNGEIEFRGRLTVLPSTGLVGQWMVGGTVVHVDSESEIEIDNGPPAIGACIKVEGTLQADGSILAREVEVKSAADGCGVGERRPREVELSGIIQALPPGGTIGGWLVSGRTVIVDSSTELEFDGSPAEGVCVEVKGTLQMGNIILASEIESDSEESHCGSGPNVANNIEIRGLVSELPALGVIGQWRIAGMRIRVSAATSVELRGAPLAAGSCVEVHGKFLANGSVLAAKLQAKPAEECANSSGLGEARFFGLVTAMPQAGLEGTWAIGFRPVVVSQSTQIEVGNGRLGRGACVAVEGTQRTDGLIAASKLEVKSRSGVCVFPNGIIHAGSGASGAVSPGQIVSIFGLSMGPAAGMSLKVENGRIASELAGVRVWFDGVAAPILFASATQLNVVVPYSVSRRATTEMQVEWSGGWSQPVELPVAKAALGLFTLTQTGTGPAAVLNFNAQTRTYTVNSPANPARKGEIVVLFGTGEGTVQPAVPDGLLISGTLPKPVSPLTVTVGGRSSTVLYAGGAPGMVAGVLQVNMQVAVDAPSGSQVPVQLHTNGVSSPANVTIAVE